MLTKAIPIEAAKRIAESYGYDQIVIMARKTGVNGLEHVTTFGVNKEHCAIATKMGDILKHKIMGWPEQVNSEPMQTFKSAFEDLLKQDTEAALQLITGMFVGITLEYMRRRGFETDKEITIEGNEKQRAITIHAISS